jgi:hypothetical protein
MYRASPEVVSVMVKSYPDGVGVPTDCNSYPLHLASRCGCSAGVLEAILSTPEGVSTIRYLEKSRTPLQLLTSGMSWEDFHSTYRAVRKSYDEGRLQQPLPCNIYPINIQAYWRKVCLLAVVEYLCLPFHQNSLTPEIIIRACVGNPKCPIEFQEFAVFLYSSSLMIADCHGSLPIHVAAQEGSLSVLPVLAGCAPDSAKVRDSRGRLPLLLAEQHKKPGQAPAMMALFGAHPAGLEDLELRDELYPSVWARVTDPSTLYESILAHQSIFCRRQNRVTTK